MRQAARAPDRRALPSGAPASVVPRDAAPARRLPLVRDDRPRHRRLLVPSPRRAVRRPGGGAGRAPQGARAGARPRLGRGSGEGVRLPRLRRGGPAPPEGGGRLARRFRRALVSFLPLPVSVPRDGPLAGEVGRVGRLRRRPDRGGARPAGGPGEPRDRVVPAPRRVAPRDAPADGALPLRSRRDGCRRHRGPLPEDDGFPAARGGGPRLLPRHRPAAPRPSAGARPPRQLRRRLFPPGALDVRGPAARARFGDEDLVVRCRGRRSARRADVPVRRSRDPRVPARRAPARGRLPLRHPAGRCRAGREGRGAPVGPERPLPEARGARLDPRHLPRRGARTRHGRPRREAQARHARPPTRS